MKKDTTFVIFISVCHRFYSELRTYKREEHSAVKGLAGQHDTMLKPGTVFNCKLFVGIK